MFQRVGDGLEFERTAFFTDAIFAIAMTLLVVGIGVPVITNVGEPGEMLEALSDLLPEFVSFFVGFAVIGSYWFAHHRFFGKLRSVDTTLIRLNLIYLALIAFLPFPTGLLGRYETNPISVVAFATVAAGVSTMEVVIYRHAWRRHHFKFDMPKGAFRWGAIASLVPVATFAISVPLAFINTWLAIACWFLPMPGEWLLDRAKPPVWEEYFT